MTDDPRRAHPTTPPLPDAPADEGPGSASPGDAPLCVDLDGTLVACDTLHHLLGRLAITRPWHCVDLPFQLLAGKARFKERVSDRIAITPAHLPWRQPVLEYLRQQRTLGRLIVLATAADHRIADAVADHLGIFDSVLATRNGANLSGASKRDVIRATVGSVYDYIGDSWADLPIFRDARYALLVAPHPRLHRTVLRSCRLLHVFP